MKKVLRYGARVIGILLILFGLYQLAAPSISNWLIENNIIKQSEVFDKTSAEDIQKNKQKKGTFDFDAITAINPSETLLNPANIDPSLIIGRLYIPSIQVNLILFNGLNNDILNAGVGTMREDQEMGKGNYPVAGHWMGRDDLLLSALKNMKNDDEIYITDKDKAYKYVMYDMKVVDQTEVGWIENSIAEKRGGPIISLMNCVYVKNKGFAGYSDTGTRRFVFGDLKEVMDYKDFKKEKEKKDKATQHKKRKNKKSASRTDWKTLPQAA